MTPRRFATRLLAVFAASLLLLGAALVAMNRDGGERQS